MVVGILNTFAAFARATVLFFSVWRSIDWTANAICGWWSMKMICVFCGVRTSSFGLAMGDLLRLVCDYVRSSVKWSGLTWSREQGAPNRRNTVDPICSLADSLFSCVHILVILIGAIYCTWVARD